MYTLNKTFTSFSLCCCQLVNTWMSDCKAPRYKTNTKVNSAFYPSGVSNRVPFCVAGVMAGLVHLLSDGRQVTLCDPI